MTTPTPDTSIFTRAFWSAAAERAGKTFIEAFAGWAIAATTVDMLLDWRAFVLTVLVPTAASIGLSAVSAGKGGTASPSLTGAEVLPDEIGTDMQALVDAAAEADPELDSRTFKGTFKGLVNGTWRETSPGTWERRTGATRYTGSSKVDAALHGTVAR